MQKLFLILLPASLLFSCKTQPETDTKEELSKAIIQADTLHHYEVYTFNGKTVAFLPATMSEFEETRDKGSQPDDPQKDSSLLAHDNGFIFKKDSVISIRCRTGLVKLVEHTTCDGEGFLEYKYAGSLKSLPIAVFSEGHNLGLNYVLVNAHSGKMTRLWGIPQLSPDGKKIIAASYDLDAGYMKNGLQVFAVEVDSLRLLWKQDFEDWGPEALKWADNQTILIKQVTPVDGNGKEIVTYARVKVGD